MIEDTLHKIETRLQKAPNLSEDNREALQRLLNELRAEIACLDDADRAESIAGFAESSTREALRNEQDGDLLDLSLQGLEQSTRSFEASHPRLTAVVNNICQQLSNLGI
jgi:transposase